MLKRGHLRPEAVPGVPLLGLKSNWTGEYMLLYCCRRGLKTMAEAESGFSKCSLEIEMILTKNNEKE